MEDPEKSLEAGKKSCDEKSSQVIQAEKKANVFIEWKVSKCEIKINRHLLSLKLVFIFTFTAASSILSFLPVFLKQRGLTLRELSVILNISYSLQAIFSPIIGIIVDKLGRIKFLVTVCMAASAFFALSLIYIPSAQRVENSFCFLNTANCSSIFSENATALQNISSKLLFFDNFDENCYVNKSICNYYLRVNVNGHFIYSNDSIKFNFSYNENQTARNKNHSLLCSSNGNNKQNMHCTRSSEDFLAMKNKDHTMLVVIYGAIVCVQSVFLEKTFRLVDVIAMSLVSKHDTDYGKEKFWSTFGYFAGPFLAGIVAQYFSESGEKNYNYSIYLFTIQSLMSILAVYLLSLPARKPANKMWKKAMILSKNIDITSVAIILVILGSTYGFRISFKNWYLEDIGADAYCIGITDGLFGLYSMPFLLSSKWIISKLGKKNIFLVSLLGSALNSFGYALLEVPWPAMLLEFTWGITFHLFWVAVVEFCKDVAPPDLLATACVMAGCLHFAVGKVVGSSVGGYFMSSYGGRITYKIMGTVQAFCFIIYSCYLLFLRKK